MTHLALIIIAQLLLNIDTKIIAYTLAQRIKPLLHKTINSDQHGYIKKQVYRIQYQTNTGYYRLFRKFNVEGAILFLDFSKAFDSFEWEFMYLSLEKFGIQKSIMIDFSKAFDSFEWEFMYLSLEKFGFQISIMIDFSKASDSFEWEFVYLSLEKFGF